MWNPSSFNLNGNGRLGLSSRTVLAHVWSCGCDEHDVIRWPHDLAEMGLGGDRDARRLLPAAGEHYLAAERLEAGAIL